MSIFESIGIILKEKIPNISDNLCKEIAKNICDMMVFRENISSVNDVIVIEELNMTNKSVSL